MYVCIVSTIKQNYGPGTFRNKFQSDFRSLCVRDK